MTLFSKKMLWGIALLLIIISFSQHAADATPPVPYDRQVDWALNLLEKQRYPEAADAAQALMAADPNNALSLEIRGTLELQVGSIARASADFHTAAHSRTDVISCYGLALCAMFHHDLAGAKTWLKEAGKAPNVTVDQTQDIQTAQAYTDFLTGDLQEVSQILRDTKGGDKAREELAAITSVRTHAPDAKAKLKEFLNTDNGVPQVCEDDGVRMLFTNDPLPIEPAVTETVLQQMYIARIASSTPETENHAGLLTKVSGIAVLKANNLSDPLPPFITFFIDGQLVSSLNTSPYIYNWDTTTVTNGNIRCELMLSTQKGIP